MGLMGYGRGSSRIGRGNSKLNMDYTVLTLDGWLEFNHRKWGLSPLRLNLSEGTSDRPAVELVVYTDKRGRIKTPKLNPYTPVAFLPTDTQSVPRLERQWLSVSELAVREFRERGVVNAVSFPPPIVDVRPWKWSNFQVDVSYSFYMQFPYDSEAADKRIRTKIRKAAKLGYICEQTSEISDVVECLEDTGERQGFDHRLSIEDLKACQRLLGQNVLRAYVCYAPNGDAASARLALGYRGASAIGWVSGTKREYLQDGCAQLLMSFGLEDLQNAGASGFDWAGANLPTVAAAKAAWGGQLVPFYTIRQPNARALALYMRHFCRFSLGNRQYP
jgi:hypothetical protein